MSEDYRSTEFSAPLAGAPMPPPSRERFAARAVADIPGELVDVRGNHTLTLRPIAPGDATALQRCFARLAPDVTQYRFLHAMAALPTPLAEQICTADPAHGASLVCADAHVQPAEIRALGRSFIDETTDSAELSLLVEDAWSRDGLDALLLERLLADCRKRHLAEAWSYVRGSDTALLALCARLGFSRHAVAGEPDAVQVLLRLQH